MRTMNWYREGNELVYRASIDNLIYAFNNCPLFYNGEDDSQTYQTENEEEFITELIISLNRENEDGTTPTFTLFDESFNYMIEQGAEGIRGYD